MTGYIQLPREIISHEVFDRNPSYFHPFVKLCAKAVYGDDRTAGGMTLRPGDVWTSQQALSLEWTWGRNRVKRFLDELKAADLLTFTTDKRRNGGHTVVSISFLTGILIGAGIKRASNEASNGASNGASNPALSRASKKTLSHREFACADETVEHQNGENSGIKTGINGRGTIAPRGAPTKKQYTINNLTPNGGVVWAEWISANRDASREDPARVPANLKAAKELAAIIPDEGQRKTILRAYLADPDTFLQGQGYALRFLATRIDKYRNSQTDAAASFYQSADQAALTLCAQIAAQNPHLNGKENHT